MASQIAHIVYAKKYLESLELAKMKGKLKVETFLAVENKLNKDEFILGAVFPDIRRIDQKITRQDTHLQFTPLNLDFSGLTSFQAGWKFHLYCDMRREAILNKEQFYSLKNTDKFYGAPAKLLEDEIIYEEYNNWEKIVNYFRNPPYIKTNIAITKETFYLWYAILAKYMEKKPTLKTLSIFLSKMEGFSENLDAIESLIAKMRTDKKILSYLQKIQEKIL